MLALLGWIVLAVYLVSWSGLLGWWVSCFLSGRRGCAADATDVGAADAPAPPEEAAVPAHCALATQPG